MPLPLVSILIPAFNAERHVGETLASALAQTWPRIEVIVVDDGSTDRTVDVVSGVGDSRIKLITQPNQGAAHARNTAYAACAGDYVQWLDADDCLHPDKISLQMAALTGDDDRVLLSSAWAHFLFRTRVARFHPSSLWADTTPLEWLLRKMENDAHMQPATWLTSRRLADAAGPWDARLLVDDDGEYFCRVILACSGIRFVPGARTFYRITGSGSLSRIGDSARKLEAQMLSCRMHVNYVMALDSSERSRRACSRYLQKYLLYFVHRRPDLARECEALALSLGEVLQPPALGRKYAWLERAFGLPIALRLQRAYNGAKWDLIRGTDRLVFNAERLLDRRSR